MAVKRRVFFGIGSNLGDRQLFLDLATKALSTVFGKAVEKSSIYQTSAWGLTDQPDFYNQVIAYETVKSSTVVFERIMKIERKLGRVRKTKWGPRTIDIDLLFYGDLSIKKPKLIVPHPRIAERRFVLAPLVEIAPKFIHPILNKNLKELLDHCKDDQTVKRLVI